MRLNITLLNVPVKIMRRMDVPVETNLEDLHIFIQATMGWRSCHLWGFYAKRYGRRVYWSPEEDEQSLNMTFLDVLHFLQGHRHFFYTYDYGDNWEHRIHIGKIERARDDRKYPYLLSATGRCPPENIGGGCGYSEFLEGLENPNADPSNDEYYSPFLDENDSWDAEDPEIEVRRGRLEYERNEYEKYHKRG
ncbi:MAG: plasmid pRiA4b ORF-3 family protein [Gammaproteobacteria bacterium]|nr:plasmid pRiA4b ORF-3 family protein [Gammaproteobacteria bacterium]